MTGNGGALDPVPSGIELEARRLALDPMLEGTELVGRRLALVLVLDITRGGPVLDPGPTGTVPLEVGTGDADEVDCGATEVLFRATAPYPSP